MTRTTHADKTVTTACRNLRAALMEDLSISKRLVANAEAQRAALVDGDHARLTQLTEDAGSLVELAESNGVRRDAAILAVVRAVGQESSLKDHNPTLPELARRLPYAEAKPLLDLRTSLLDNQRVLQDLNEGNRLLTQTGLDLVNWTYQAIAEMATKPAGYGQCAVVAPSPTFYLDHKA